MRYFTLPFVLSLLSALAFSALRGQTDSLLTEVARPRNDTSDVNALIELGKATFREDMPRAISYARQAATLSDSRVMEVWAARSYRQLGALHYLSANIDSFSFYNALALSRRSARLYEALGMVEELPSVEISRGIGFYDSGEKDKAEQLIKEAIETPGLKIDASGYANALLGLGSICLESERYEEAAGYLEEGLPYAEQTNILALVTNFNRALGQTYEALNRPDKAYGHFTSYVDTIEQVFAQERLDVYGEAAEKFQSQLREAEIERQQLVIGQQRQRSQLLWLGIGFLALLSLGIFLLLRSRLKFQKSEALRKESERKAEVHALKQAAEVSGLRSMIEGQEVERKRVAKDLHDGLGGLLATVKARLSAEAPLAVAASGLLDRACTEVRRIAHNMVPQTLALSGLSGSIRDMVDQLNMRGLDTELEIVGQPDLRLSEDGEAMILRILQELTHNVVKHAKANKLFLQLIDQPRQLMLTVEDDGVGFDASPSQTQNGIGLGSIDSRVTYLKGEIQYDSSPGHGTTVTLGKEEVLIALDRARRGKKYFSEEINDMLIEGTSRGEKTRNRSPFPRLSRREKEVLTLIVDEFTTQEIADKLFISFGTVETHRRNILSKLGARNTAGLVRVALEYRLLED